MARWSPLQNLPPYTTTADANLRSWLRPHRGISQEKLPLYLDFFAFVHNARRRGKALLGALVAALVT